MSDLADALGVTPRNITALVDGLEEEGMVRRVAHPDGSPRNPDRADQGGTRSG